MTKFPILILTLLVAALLAGCAGRRPPVKGETILETVAVEGGKYNNIDAPKLQKMLENKDFALVNVHIPFEGNLPNTDLSIPYNEIEANLGRLPIDKNAKIVLYCRSGRMSQEAAEELVRLGYTNIWNLVGGMAAWERTGLPIEGR